MPTFSVIIPAYNRSSYLRQTLESVWRQTFNDYEIIVVDDGSTDDTLTYLSEISDKVTVIRQPNCGPGTARNKGAENARGAYLAFLDSDDLWFPWTLETVSELIVRHDSPSLIAAKLFGFTNPSEFNSLKPAKTSVQVFSDYLASSDRDCFVGAGMMFVRRDKFVEAGGFSSRHINLEDHDLVLRLGTAKGFVRIDEPPTLGWRRHDDSATDHFRRSFEGCRHLIANEQHGVYPGGKKRRVARRKIITRHIRPWALTFARTGEWRPAWSLYSSTFVWNLSLNRWRFLMGFWSNLL
ncbi:MAG TPA: glycosyltransferase family A protein [Pyrinomonadaceae bacterium]|nr:glycosyltransferase family A protein [Pyrinomonadaceae bacterium]